MRLISRIGPLDKPDASLTRRSPLCGINSDRRRVWSKTVELPKWTGRPKPARIDKASADVAGARQLALPSRRSKRRMTALKPMLKRAKALLQTAPFDGFEVLTPALSLIKPSRVDPAYDRGIAEGDELKDQPGRAERKAYCRNRRRASLQRC